MIPIIDGRIFIKQYSVAYSSLYDKAEIVTNIRDNMLRLLKNLKVKSGYYLLIPKYNDTVSNNVTELVIKILTKGGYKKENGTLHAWNGIIVDDIRTSTRNILRKYNITNKRLLTAVDTDIPVLCSLSTELSTLSSYNYDLVKLNTSNIHYISKKESKINTLLYLSDGNIDYVEKDLLEEEFAEMHIIHKYIIKYGEVDGIRRFFKRMSAIMPITDKTCYKLTKYNYNE